MWTRGRSDADWIAEWGAFLIYSRPGWEAERWLELSCSLTDRNKTGFIFGQEHTQLQHRHHIQLVHTWFLFLLGITFLANIEQDSWWEKLPHILLKKSFRIENFFLWIFCNWIRVRMMSISKMNYYQNFFDSESTYFKFRFLEVK